ncbi:MAG: hypothetical protein ACRD12_17080 [Acidimicrobiales bacterium]
MRGVFAKLGLVLLCQRLGWESPGPGMDRAPSTASGSRSPPAWAEGQAAP